MELTGQQGGASVTRSHGLRVKAIHTESRECDFVASTDAIDSYDESVDQNSWDLTRYQANPIVLYAHNSRDLPIGKSTKCGVVNGQLECRIKFVTEDMNPLAEQVWKLLQADVLRAVSVGFDPKTVRYEKRNDKSIYVLADCELYEISVVPVPANADALSKMKAKALQSARSPTQQPTGREKAAQETHMDIEQIKAKLAETETALRTTQTESVKHELAATQAATKAAALETELKAVTAAKTAIEGQLSRITDEHKSVSEKFASLQAQIVERSVDDLVGKKITPAQKDAFVSLAKASPDQFDAIVKGLPEMTILNPVIPSTKGEPAPAPAAGVADNGNALSDLMGHDEAAE